MGRKSLEDCAGGRGLFEFATAIRTTSWRFKFLSAIVDQDKRMVSAKPTGDYVGRVFLRKTDRIPNVTGQRLLAILTSIFFGIIFCTSRLIFCYLDILTAMERHTCARRTTRWQWRCWSSCILGGFRRGLLYRRKHKRRLSEDTAGLSTTSITDVLYEGTQITFDESLLLMLFALRHYISLAAWMTSWNYFIFTAPK